MSFLRSTFALTVLLGALPAIAADAADWRVPLDAGNLAEDQSEYKKAEKELTKACRLASAELNDHAAGRTACVRLAQVQAVRGRLMAANKTLNRLVDALRERGSLEDLAVTLLELSDIEAARSQFDSVVEHLREALRIVPGLSGPLRVRTLTQTAQHYLAVGREDTGTALLDRAQAELLTGLSMHDAAAVIAVSHLAGLLRANEYRNDAATVLQPVVRAARERFAASRGTPRDLQKAYERAAHLQAALLADQEQHDDSEALRREIDQWEKLWNPPSGSVRPDEVSAPPLAPQSRAVVHGRRNERRGPGNRHSGGRNLAGRQGSRHPNPPTASVWTHVEGRRSGSKMALQARREAGRTGEGDRDDRGELPTAVTTRSAPLPHR